MGVEIFIVFLSYRSEQLSNLTLESPIGDRSMLQSLKKIENTDKKSKFF